MKIHSRGKFHQNSICGCEVKGFESFVHRFSIYEMVLFGRFFGPYVPKYGPILPKFSPAVAL